MECECSTLNANEFCDYTVRLPSFVVLTFKRKPATHWKSHSVTVVTKTLENVNQRDHLFACRFLETANEVLGTTALDCDLSFV